MAKQPETPVTPLGKFEWSQTKDKSRLMLLLVVGALLRVLLQSTPLQQILNAFAPLHTPTSSWKRFSEGLFLYQHGIALYDNSIFHQSPLFLPLFTILPKWTHPLVFVSLDMVAACCLYVLAHRQLILEPLAHIPASNEDDMRLLKSAEVRDSDHWPASWVVGCFLFNPFSLISCLIMDVGIIERTCMLIAAAAACQGDSVWSSLALSVAFQHGFYAMALVPIVAMIQRRANQLSCMALIPAMTISVGAWLGISALFMYHIMGLNPVNVFTSTIGFMYCSFNIKYGFEKLNVSDMAPNIGSWWYFLQEVFDHFRSLFVFVFQAHVFVYLIPMLIRYGKDLPIFCFGAYLGVIAILRSYPTVGDYAVWFACMPMYANSWKYHRYSFVSTTLFLFTSMLFPAMYLLYARFHSGNANFPYALTLLACSAATMMQSDFMFGVLVRIHHAVTRSEVFALHRAESMGDGDGDAIPAASLIKEKKGLNDAHELLHLVEFPSVLMYSAQ